MLKLPKKVPKAVQIPIAAQAATAPVLLANFGYISGAGLLMNLLIIPVLSSFYVVLFIGTVSAAVFPFIAFLLPYAVLPLETLISFFTAIGFENTLVVFSGGTWLAFYYSGLSALSDKLNIKPYVRFIAVCCAMTAMCAYFIFA